MTEERFMDARSGAPIAGRPALLGCPLDATSTFRSGCAHGPSAIRWGSYSIESYSFLLDRDLGQHPFVDMGDLRLEGLDVEAALAMTETRVSEILAAGAVPFLLGGEHTITLPAVKAALKVHPALEVIHIDAHTDLRDHYEGSPINHATVMRRTAELMAARRIVQLGLRSGTREEFEYARNHTCFLGWGPGAERKLFEAVSDHPLYITVDLDALDPSCLPGTGNPEPGGWTYHDMERFILAIRRLRVVGIDVVELNPTLDPSGVSSITAAKVVRELLLATA